MNSLSDLPTPAASVITLLDDTTYQISGAINLGANRLQLGDNTQIAGTNPSSDSLVSTTTGALFTGANFRARDFSVSVAGGDVFSITGTATDAIILNGFGVITADTLGIINGGAIFAWRFSSVQALLTKGLLLQGNIKTVKIIESTWLNYEGIGIDFGSSTADFIQIKGCKLSPNAAATSVSILATSGNLNASGQGYVTQNLFNGSGTAITGHDPKDERWITKANSGVQDSIVGAAGHILGSGTATTISAMSTPVPVGFGTGWIADQTDQFTVSTAGRFTYTGDTEANLSISASLYGDSASGTNISYRFYFAKNGVILPGSVAQEQYDSADPHSTPVFAIVAVADGDYIELWVENITSTSDITIETASIQMIGV